MRFALGPPKRTGSDEVVSGTHSARATGGAPLATPSVESGPHSIAADIVAVFTLTISSVGFAISLAALIFGGTLESGMSRAIGSFVIGTGIMAIVVARRSHIVPVATFVQDAPAIVMAAVVADFIADEHGEVADVFVLLVVTMLATSLVTGLLGHFGLGALGRCLPTLVVGAFVGGTGWLVLKGGFDVMTTGVGPVGRGEYFHVEAAKFWAPGLATGLIGWLVSRSKRMPGYALGLVVCACLVGFYIAVALASSISAVEAGGWLLGPFPERGGTTLVTPDEFRAADWSGIARMTPGIASVVGLACVAQLLSLTGIRAELFPELNIDAELRTSASANLAAALCGVTPGFQGLGYTVLLNRLGATGRAVSVVSGSLVVAFGIAGVAAVGYVPRFVVGALLVMIGVALLDDWLQGLLRLTSVGEQVLGIAIVVAVTFFGLVQGVGVGLVAAGVVFVVRYSRVDPVRSVRNGGNARGHVDRSLHEVERLMAASHRLVVFELQGYLFFGSLTMIEDRVREATRSPRGVQTLVLDFANVTGVDSSGFALVASLLREVRTAGVETWISALDAELTDALLDYDSDLAAHVEFIYSLDDALEIAENRLLATTPPDTQQQQRIRNPADLSRDLLAEFTAFRYLDGAVVMAQGAPSFGLLIVQRGHLTSFRREADGTHTRRRRFGEFSVVGELGPLAETPRTVTVVADEIVDGWWLSVDRYRSLQTTKPWLIFELHDFIVRTQAERMNSLSQFVRVSCE